ncbi:acyl-CoA carboxylase subunit epsilon [Streptomyces sp. NPDC020362]|uniref:acyl-CoA carboxylase subunit epsilon n=1 Tax=unclassified Streptomyces TaxID=2593676 RepID=UPI000B30302F
MSKETCITVVRGCPGADEIAAVTAVLLALAHRAQEPGEEVRTAYAAWAVKRGGYRPTAASPGP